MASTTKYPSSEKVSGHASEGVTLKHYQDFPTLDFCAEIGKLPEPRRDQAAKAVRATGTEDAKSVVRPVAMNPGRKGVKLSANGRIGNEVSRPCHKKNSL